jgi:hypothetical protein
MKSVLTQALKWCPRADNHGGLTIDQLDCGVCSRIFYLAARNPAQLTREVVMSIDVDTPALGENEEFAPAPGHVLANAQPPAEHAQQNAQVMNHVVRRNAYRDIRVEKGTTTVGSWSESAAHAATAGHVQEPRHAKGGKGERPAPPPIPAQDHTRVEASALSSLVDHDANLSNAQSAHSAPGVGGCPSMPLDPPRSGECLPTATSLLSGPALAAPGGQSLSTGAKRDGAPPTLAGLCSVHRDVGEDAERAEVSSTSADVLKSITLVDDIVSSDMRGPPHNHVNPLWTNDRTIDRLLNRVRSQPAIDAAAVLEPRSVDPLAVIL